MSAFDQRVVKLYSRIAEAAGLLQSRRQVVEWIGAGVILHSILTVIDVAGQELRVVNNPRVEERNVDAFVLLALVLSGELLIKLVGDLEPGAGEVQVEMQRVLLGRLPI